MKCLRCESVELEVQTRGEGDDVFEIDVCPSCAGTWLDPEELKHLDDNFFVDMEEIEYEEVSPSAEDAALCCVRCEGSPTMKKVHPAGYPEVVVDSCPTCKGFWLDKDEMEKIRDVSDKLLIASLLPLDE